MLRIGESCDVVAKTNTLKFDAWDAHDAAKKSSKATSQILPRRLTFRTNIDMTYPTATTASITQEFKPAPSCFHGDQACVWWRHLQTNLKRSHPRRWYRGPEMLNPSLIQSQVQRWHANQIHTAEVQPMPLATCLMRGVHWTSLDQKVISLFPHKCPHHLYTFSSNLKGRVPWTKNKCTGRSGTPSILQIVAEYCADIGHSRMNLDKEKRDKDYRVMMHVFRWSLKPCLLLVPQCPSASEPYQLHFHHQPRWSWWARSCNFPAQHSPTFFDGSISPRSCMTFDGCWIRIVWSWLSRSSV